MMFKKFLTIIFAFFCLTIAIYLVLPNYTFPTPLPDSLKSQEPADLETPLRQGYFTNYSRDEVISWYRQQFSYKIVFGHKVKLPTLLLNYPPEDAETIIRDQTSSTFLQELVHPLRESIYINGFKPSSVNNKPQFYVDGKTWDQKIIIRFIPGNVMIRELIFIATAFMTVILFKAFLRTFNKNK